MTDSDLTLLICAILIVIAFAVWASELGKHSVTRRKLADANYHLQIEKEHGADLMRRLHDHALRIEYLDKSLLRYCDREREGMRVLLTKCLESDAYVKPPGPDHVFMPLLVVRMRLDGYLMRGFADRGFRETWIREDIMQLIAPKIVDAIEAAEKK